MSRLNEGSMPSMRGGFYLSNEVVDLAPPSARWGLNSFGEDVCANVALRWCSLVAYEIRMPVQESRKCPNSSAFFKACLTSLASSKIATLFVVRAETWRWP